MSTRSVFTFIDNPFGTERRFSVYKHSDGYPSGALAAVADAIPFAWPSPRFEANDFAAAFVRGNKNGGGNIYFTTKPEDHGDLEFDYEVYFQNDILMIRQFNWIGGYSDNKRGDVPVYDGQFSDYAQAVDRLEEEANA